MSAVLINERLPSEVGDSDTYNRIQMRHAVKLRGDPGAESHISDENEPLRVLIVDDNHVLADIESKLVKIWGHEVMQAHDGRTALALANAYQPDVLLLDLVMSEMTGLEVARQMRQQERLRKCFVVVVTGATQARLWPLCGQAGVDLILVKPVAPSILKALLSWEAEYVLRSEHGPAAEINTTALIPRASRRNKGFSPATD